MYLQDRAKLRKIGSLRWSATTFIIPSPHVRCINILLRYSKNFQIKFSMQISQDYCSYMQYQLPKKIQVVVMQGQHLTATLLERSGHHHHQHQMVLTGSIITFVQTVHLIYCKWHSSYRLL